MGLSIERGVFTTVLGLGGTGAIMMWPDQWWIGAGLLSAAGLVLLWGVRVHDKHVWTAFGSWFQRHVSWRFRLQAPVAAQGPSPIEKPPTQTIEMPFLTHKAVTVPPPLKEVERGPCLQAILQIRKFLLEEVGPFHAQLAEARNSKDMSGLLPVVHTFRASAERLKGSAEMLQATHRPMLRRMDAPELTPLANELNELKTKLIRVKEGRTWERPALMERINPMHDTNLKVGRMAADLLRAYDDKHAEFFT